MTRRGTLRSSGQHDAYLVFSRKLSPRGTADILDGLLGAVRRRSFRETTESEGPRGYDAGKKIKGRMRHALVDVATATRIAVEIVRGKPDQVGFAVQPRCWVVERFFAWITQQALVAGCRVLKDASRKVAASVQAA